VQYLRLRQAGDALSLSDRGRWLYRLGEPPSGGFSLGLSLPERRAEPTTTCRYVAVAANTGRCRRAGDRQTAVRRLASRFL